MPRSRVVHRHMRIGQRDAQLTEARHTAAFGASQSTHVRCRC
jgi:hypothetical protein